MALLFLFLLASASGWFSQTKPRQTPSCCPLPPSCSQFARSTRAGELLGQLDGSADAYVQLGELSLEQDEVPCAEWAFQTALGKEPQLWGAHYGLGLVAIQSGQPMKAKEELQIALQQKPDDAMTHNALGLALEALGSHDAAVEEFERALKLDPKFDLGHYNLAHTLRLLIKDHSDISHLYTAV